MARGVRVLTSAEILAQAKADAEAITAEAKKVAKAITDKAKAEDKERKAKRVAEEKAEKANNKAIKKAEADLKAQTEAELKAKAVPDAAGKGEEQEKLPIDGEKKPKTAGADEEQELAYEQQITKPPKITTLEKLARSQADNEEFLVLVSREWRLRGFPEIGAASMMIATWNKLMLELGSPNPAVSAPRRSEDTEKTAHGKRDREPENKDPRGVYDLENTVFLTQEGETLTVSGRAQKVGCHIPTQGGQATGNTWMTVELHPHAEKIVPVGRLCRVESSKDKNHHLVTLDRFFSLSQNDKVLQFSAAFCGIVKRPPSGVDLYWATMQKSGFVYDTDEKKNQLETAALRGGFSGLGAKSLYEMAVTVAVIAGGQEELFDQVPRNDVAANKVILDSLISRAQVLLDLNQNKTNYPVAEAQAILRNAFGASQAAGNNNDHLASSQGARPPAAERGHSVMVGWAADMTQPSPGPARQQSIDQLMIQNWISEAVHKQVVSMPARNVPLMPTRHVSVQPTTVVKVEKKANFPDRNAAGEKVCRGCGQPGHMIRACTN